MQRSTLSITTAITLTVGSCLSLVASLFIILFTQSDYFLYNRFGSIRTIDTPFFVRLVIIGFDLFAFTFGLISAIQTLRGKGSKFSLLGGGFVLVAGLLFFASSLINVFLPVDFSVSAWWWILQGFLGLPIVFIASIALALGIAEKRGIQLAKKTSLLLISGALMVLCSIEAVFFAYMAYSPAWTYSFQTALSDSSFLTPIYSWILSALTFAFSIGAGILLLLRKQARLSITLTILALFSGLLLSMIFTSTIYYSLVWSWLGGPIFEVPIITLSALALILALYSQRQKNQGHLLVQ